MIINSSKDLFFTVDTKSVSVHSEKSNSLSFQDCMKEKSEAASSDSKKVDDNTTKISDKNDYKRDSYKDSSSRVKKSDSSENQEVKELSKDDLSKMSDEMKEKIMDRLSMTEEELEEIMSALNLSWMDLLIPDKLQALVLACEGKGQVDLLTDENLNQCLQSVLNDLKEVLSGQGVDYEQLETAIETLESEGFEEVLTQKEVEAIETKTDDVKTGTETVSIENTQSNQKEQNLSNSLSGEKQSFNFERSDDNSVGSENVGSEQQVVTTVVQQDFQQVVTTVRETESQGVVSQVITQVKIMASEDTNSIQMQLYPEHLGRLSIEISEKSGIMSAQLVVESEDAKQALISSMNELKDAFQEQNLEVTKIEVAVAPKSFEHQEQSAKEQEANSKKSGKSGMRTLRLDDILEEDVIELVEEEKIAVEMMQLNGNSVDFTA